MKGFLQKSSFFILLTGFYAAVFQPAFAQTEPYYKLPGNRIERNSSTFPNLESHLVKLYIRPEGGMFFQGNSISNTLNDKLSKKNLYNANWGLSLGFNYRDRWLFDIGYLQTPLSMTNTFVISPFSIPNTETIILHGIPLRVQRKVWTIDRVARSTGLYVGGAVIVSTDWRSRSAVGQQAFLERNRNGVAPDTLRLIYQTALNKIPAQLETFVEIRGKLIEALEIGAFVKLQTSFSSPLISEISFRRNRGTPEVSVQKLNPYALRFGLSVHYNFGIIRKYESKVE